MKDIMTEVEGKVKFFNGGIKDDVTCSTSHGQSS